MPKSVLSIVPAVNFQKGGGVQTSYFVYQSSRVAESCKRLADWVYLMLFLKLP